MQTQRLEPDLYVLVGKAYDSNAAAFVKGEEVLLVDALANAEDAAALREFVETQLGKRVRFIVCTHYFSDHLAALKLFPSAQIIAHKNYMHTFSSERHRTEEEAAHFVEPDILVSDELEIRWGRYALEIFHNPGHTLSTLGIDVPAADLIIAGDTVVGNIAYLSYSTPEMLSHALRRLHARGRGRLLSSHMGVRGSEALRNALAYLDNLQRHVMAARRAVDGEEAILGIELESCLGEGVEGSDFERIFHGRNLESIVEQKMFAAA